MVGDIDAGSGIKLGVSMMAWRSATRLGQGRSCDRSGDEHTAYFFP